MIINIIYRIPNKVEFGEPTKLFHKGKDNAVALVLAPTQETEPY
jgi:hypothetical protein